MENAAKSYIIKLQRVQNRAARIISAHLRDTRIAQLHDGLDIPYLDTIIDQLHRNFWKRVQYSTSHSYRNADRTTTTPQNAKTTLIHHLTYLHTLPEKRQLLL